MNGIELWEQPLPGSGIAGRMGIYIYCENESYVGDAETRLALPRDYPSVMSAQTLARMALEKYLELIRILADIANSTTRKNIQALTTDAQHELHVLMAAFLDVRKLFHKSFCPCCAMAETAYVFCRDELWTRLRLNPYFPERSLGSGARPNLSQALLALPERQEDYAYREHFHSIYTAHKYLAILQRKTGWEFIPYKKLLGLSSKNVARRPPKRGDGGHGKRGRPLNIFHRDDLFVSRERRKDWKKGHPRIFTAKRLGMSVAEMNKYIDRARQRTRYRGSRRK